MKKYIGLCDKFGKKKVVPAALSPALIPMAFSANEIITFWTMMGVSYGFGIASASHFLSASILTVKNVPTSKGSKLVQGFQLATYGVVLSGCIGIGLLRNDSKNTDEIDQSVNEIQNVNNQPADAERPLSF